MPDTKIGLKNCVKLLAGSDFWHTAAVPESDVPSMMMSDGPHGLRKQSEDAHHLGIHDSVEAVCFPSAGCIASSFDKDLARLMGGLLGEECRAEGVQILLAPAMNIKRSPLCGRNFEYYSEDPYLTGELAAAFIQGAQQKGIGCCAKHFLANNQENGRMTVSANIDDRALREIYLKAFQRVMEERPKSVMSSYNKVNGEYAGESSRFLTDILRNEWGFDGIVISDWYAVTDRVKTLLAGLDLEMPGGMLTGGEKIENALKEGTVDIETVERSARKIADLARELCVERTDAYDKEFHHAQAVKMAEQSAVLLKNDGILPLRKDEKVLLIGDFAENPRYQGGGSSHINAYKIESAVEYLQDVQADFYPCSYVTADIETVIDELSAKLTEYDKVVVFAGLEDAYESEGYDRANIDLPLRHNAMIEKIATLHSSVVVVLMNGSPIAMPWVSKVKGILEMHLGGEGVGLACARILGGAVNPSGRLAESYPLCIEHTPSYLNSRSVKSVDYHEGVFVGYRYYSTKKIKTLFPFGYGLSYTEFEYSDLIVQKNEDRISVSVNVKNVGRVEGKEVVQMYIKPPIGGIDRPIIELKGFEKVAIKPNETVTVKFEIGRDAFAYYSVQDGAWRVDGGLYEICIMKSAEETILCASVQVDGDERRLTVGADTTLGELISNPKTKAYAEQLLKGYSLSAAEGDAIGSDMKKAMFLNAPLRLVKGIAKLDDTQFESFLRKIKALAES